WRQFSSAQQLEFSSGFTRRAKRRSWIRLTRCVTNSLERTKLQQPSTREAPNPKTQTPKKSQAPISKQHTMAEILPTDTPALFEAAIRRTAVLLRAGEVVALPTETVYGLAANALDAEAVKRIFEIKGRPSHNPI